MICNRHALIGKLRETLAANPFWRQRLSSRSLHTAAIHLAIFREPYLRFVMEGKKTVETRFAKRACPPYRRVTDGDIVLLKRAASDIVGICTVEKVWFYQVDAKTISFIRKKFGPAICPVDSSFWDERQGASVATLMLVGNVTSVDGIEIRKRDRRGWVVFEDDGQRTFW